MKPRYVYLLPSLDFAAFLLAVMVADQYSLVPLVVVTFPWSLVFLPMAPFVGTAAGVGAAAFSMAQWAFVGAMIDLFRRRYIPGTCPACGYDLRGTPGEICSECGATARKRSLGVPQDSVQDQRPYG